MSEKLCALRKTGGGTLKETALWTNSNPTSEFSAQTISLSDNVTNYNYVKLVFKSDLNQDIFSSVIHDVTTFMALKLLNTDASSYTQAGVVAMTTSNANTWRYRSYKATASNRVQFSASFPSNSATAANRYLLPYQIIGMK